MRPEGFEPTPRGLKVRCATVTPQPLGWLWLCVSIEFATAFQSVPFASTQLLQVVAPRIELSATRLSAGYGQPALDYHSLHCIKSGVSESNRSPSSQTTCASHYTSLPIISFCQWTCWELNPEALSASQSADPSASPHLVAKRLVWDSNPTCLA